MYVSILVKRKYQTRRAAIQGNVEILTGSWSEKKSKEWEKLDEKVN